MTCESGINRGIAQDLPHIPHPWIQEINLPAHFTDIPNESIYLDKDGNLFLGKENGLSIFNGNSFYHLLMNGPVYVTGNGSDTIHYACKNDMGLLLKDKSGRFTLRSLNERISRANREFTPTGLICVEDGVFMPTDRGIYHYRKGRVKYHPVSTEKGRLFLVNQRLIFIVNPMEMHLWTGEGFQVVSEKDIAQDSLLLIQKSLSLTKDYIFFDYLTNNEVIAISKEMGLVILGKDGKLITALGNREGLPDHDIRQTSMFRGDEMWILGAHSLHKINHPSALRILELHPEAIGRVYASEVTAYGVFLATSHGLFVAEPLEREKISWNIKNISGDQPESFHLIDRASDRVFAAGSGHLISILDEHTEVISDGSFTGLQAINENLVVASGDMGVMSYQRTPRGWNPVEINPTLSASFSFVSHNKGIFLLCGNQVHRLSEDLTQMKIIPFHREDLLQRLVRVNGKMYLITNIRVYRYVESEETFLPVERDHKNRMLSSSDIIIPDENEGYWMVHPRGKYKSDVLHQKVGSNKEADGSSYPVLQNLGEIVDMNIRDSMLYLTGMDKIMFFNLALLTRVKDEQLPRLSQIQSSSYKHKSVDFQIYGLEFQSTPEPEFRFRLESPKYKWSEWSPSRTIHLNRLKPGTYTLLAQSKDLYGRVSAPAHTEFSLKAPFYLAWYAYVFYSLVLLILLFLIRKLWLLDYQHAESRISQRMQTKLDDLTQEKEKSDKLVADILPDRTAEQIKSRGKAKWDKYERATVLFSDIQGFTKIAEEMNPEALIDELDQFFFHFDSVVDKYNIEKIKTIGDAYMAAGGIPEKNSTNPVEVVMAALEMQTYMQQLKSTKANIWDLRIGVHTGPVIAGVVGHKKVSYDIWGDTVNTASRMESSGSPGKVNISGITYGMVKDYFICEYRGKLPVKYKGNIDMYFVTGLRPELAVDLKGIPNKRFFTKLQLLRLGDLEDRVFETILPGLPDNLHFHSLEYARKVYNQSFLLCRAEEVEQEDRLLVRTAALMLYTGLTQSYANFENRSSVITRDILPHYHYSETQIDKICNLIMATKLPFQPNNILEKILIDTKMEFIGRPDYPAQIKLLYQEMLESGAKLNGQQFKKQQLELLYTFDFFTIAARRLREVPGEEQQSALEQERWI